MSSTMQAMTQQELIAFIEKQALTIAGLQKDQQRKLTCKVSEKGGVSVYGLGRWPVTLYKSQWIAFLDYVKSGAVERFIEANDSLLSVKE